MHKTSSKRRELIQRTAIYTVSTLFVIATVTVLVLLMLGYRFNQTSKSIEQGGLVQFSSRPGNARVTVSRANLVDTTPSKITVNPGNYPISMKRNGYETWQKDVAVKAGEILWLNYAQLVPKDLKTETVTEIPALAQAMASPNGKYIALLSDKTKQSFSIVEISNGGTKQTTLALPRDLLSDAGSSVFSIVRWSGDGDRILAKRTAKNQTDWFVIDRTNPAQSYNITSTYDVAVVDALFDPRSQDRLFIRTTTGDVRLLDSARKSLSSVLVHNVTYMSLLNGRALMYVQNDTKTQNIIGYLSLSESKGRELTRVVSTSKSMVAAGTYFNDVYVAITVGNELTVYKLNDLPSSAADDAIAMTATDTTTLPASPKFLSVRSSGRFVLTQSDRGFTTYDIELKKHVMTDVATTLPSELNWLDRYHPYYSIKDQLQVLEFDGANRHTIAKVAPGFDAVQTNDGKYIYSFGITKKGYALQRTRLILE